MWWRTLSGSSPFSRALCNLAFKHNLTQLVDFPTHSGGSTLDLIFSSPGVPTRDLNKCTQSPLHSDHSLLSFIVSEPTHLTRHCSSPNYISSTTSYQYKKADFEEISSFIMDYNLDHFYSSTDIEFLWNYLKDLILYAISLHTPTARTKLRHQPQWFTSSVRHKLHKIHSLRRYCKQHPSSHKISCLVKAESQLQDEIRLARTDFETALVSKFAMSKNPSIFKYIRSFVKGLDLPASLTYESTTVTSDVNKDNGFSYFFHWV